MKKNYMKCMMMKISNTVITVAMLFAVGSSFGQLGFKSAIENAEGGLNGLDEVKQIRLTSNGTNLYTISSNSIGIYGVDITTGDLTYVDEITKDAVTDLEGDFVPFKMAISPDRKNIYVVSNTYQQVYVFSRNDDTGLLSYVELITDSYDEQNLTQPVSITVSPDNKHVYVGVSNTNSGAVTVFSRNVSTGALTWVENISASDVNGFGGFNAVKFFNNYVYAASSQHAVVVMSRDAETGKLSYLSSVESSAMGGLKDLIVSEDGKHVYTIEDGSGNISYLTRNETTGALTFDYAYNYNGVNQPKELTMIQDTFIYVASYSDDAVSLLKRNKSTGEPGIPTLYVDGSGDIDGLKRITSLVVSPDDKYLYASGSEDCAIACFQLNAETGQLTFEKAYNEGDGGVNWLNDPVDMALTPNNDQLYIASQKSKSLAIYNVDSITGQLSFNDTIYKGEFGEEYFERISGVAASPDNKNIYVVDEVANKLFTFSRTIGGSLNHEQTFMNSGIAKLNGARDVVVSTDGKNVYVASHEDNAIVAFRRDTETGWLYFDDNENYIHGQHNIFGLRNISKLVMSPDGKSLYGISPNGYFDYGDEMVSVFLRDPSLDTLYFVDTIPGFGQWMDIEVSPDNKNVYVASEEQRKLRAYTRNQSNGLLTELQELNMNYYGVGKLSISPDGQTLYDTYYKVNSLKRDTSDGTLKSVHIIHDEDSPWLSGHGVMAVSEDSRFVYRASTRHDGIATFERMVVIPDLKSIKTDSLTHNSIYIHWTEMPTADSFQLQVATDWEFKNLVEGYELLTVTGDSYRITNLNPNTDYFFRIRAFGLGKVSEYSDYRFESTLYQPLETPVAYPAMNVSATSFDASWTKVNNATSYHVLVSKDNFENIIYFDFSMPIAYDTIFSLSELEPDTEYQYKIVAWQEFIQHSDTSNTITFHTLNGFTPPAAFAGTNVSEFGFTASWSEVPSATDYVVELSDDNFASVLNVYATQITNISLSSLQEGMEYQYRVAAIQGSDTTEYSNVVEVITTGNVFQAPNAFEAESVSTSGFTASWNEIPSAITYLLEISVNNFESVLNVFSVVEASFNVSNLQKETLYQYRVRAVSENDTSSYSNVMQVTTLSAESPLSVESSTAKRIKVYPTVTNGKIHFTLSESAHVWVFDQMGNVIHHKEFLGNSKLDLHDAASGIYFVRIQQHDKTLTRRIILMK